MVLGARRSELIALVARGRPGRGEVLIASGVVRVAGQPLIDKDTKTHAKRRVAVGAETVEALKAHRAGRLRQRSPPGRPCRRTPTCSPDHPTAASPSAQMGSRTASRSWPAQLGVRARLHDLRHFMVTQLVAGGVDWRTVSGRAGHADGHMTLATYAHFQQAQDRQAAEFMDESVSGR